MAEQARREALAKAEAEKKAAEAERKASDASAKKDPPVSLPT